MTLVRIPLRRGALPLIVLLALLLAACTHSREDSAGAAASLSEGEILQVVKTLNDAETAQAGLAVRRASSPEARAIAQRILDDHSASNERLRQFTRDNDLRLQPSELSRSLQKQAEESNRELARLRGAEFDRAYLQRQIQMHEQTIETVRDQLLPASDDPQIRQRLAAYVPRLQRHMQELEQQYAAMEGQGSRG